jgi:hypothetical protein
VLRLRLLVCGGLLGLCAAQAASSATVTVVMTGTWSSVKDTACPAACMLDGSIVKGSPFTATFTYNDQIPDSDFFVGIGSYVMNGSAGTLAFTTGNYSFIDQGRAVFDNGLVTEDGVNGFDTMGLYFDGFRISGPLPSGVALEPRSYANPTFTDYTSTALSSDRLTEIPWDVSLWDTNFYFLGRFVPGGSDIEFDGVITGLTVSVPEAGASWLLGAAGIAFALRRRANA